MFGCSIANSRGTIFHCKFAMIYFPSQICEELFSVANLRGNCKRFSFARTDLRGICFPRNFLVNCDLQGNCKDFFPCNICVFL